MGNYEPKNPRSEVSQLDLPAVDEYWRYPDMDAVLRLGCAWTKTEQKAPQHMIQEACDIREEDCRHDRSS